MQDRYPDEDITTATKQHYGIDLFCSIEQYELEPEPEKGYPNYAPLPAYHFRYLIIDPKKYTMFLLTFPKD